MQKSLFPFRCGMCGWLPLLAVTALPIFPAGTGIVRFRGSVKRGDPFQYRVRDGLIFGLDPTTETDPCQGCQIWLGPSERIKTYASIATTPHYHGLIETDVCGSDFRNSDNSGPNTPGQKNVNRPQRGRLFRFAINQRDYEAIGKANEALDSHILTLEQVSSEISQHVHIGKLNITDLSLGNLHVGTAPTIDRMEFTVELDLRSDRRR